MHHLLKVVQEAATQCSHHVSHRLAPEAHVPAMGILQRVAVVQIWMAEHQFVKLASRLEPETGPNTVTQQHKQIGGRLNYEKENSP